MLKSLGYSPSDILKRLRLLHVYSFFKITIASVWRVETTCIVLEGQLCTLLWLYRGVAAGSLIIAGCVCGYKLRVIFTMIAESETLSSDLVPHGRSVYTKRDATSSSFSQNCK